jgi:TadE-like protein
MKRVRSDSSLLSGRSARGMREAFRRGQVLVEFALLAPLLVVIVLAFADFGRAYAAGTTLDSAARDGAKAVADEYAQIARRGEAFSGSDYRGLHSLAAETVCSETRALDRHDGSSPACAVQTAVCIHDQADPYCGLEADAAVAACSDLHASWDLARERLTTGRNDAVYVEVRSCYRFTTLVHLAYPWLPFGWQFSVGDIYLQRNHTFVVAD